MPLISRRIASLVLPLLLLAGITGCGSSQAEPQDPQPEKTKAADSPADPNSPEALVKKDVTEAIKLLEKGDVAGFIENYMPLKDVENIRKFTTIEKMAENIKTGGLFEREWLKKLKAMEEGEVNFLDDEKSRAVFVVEIGGEDGALPGIDVPNPAEEKVPETKGYAGDVKAAITAGIKTLEAGDHKTFIENMFPPAELYITASEDGMKALLTKLKDHPEMVKQMIADLKALEKLTPKMNADSTEATYQLNAGTPAERTVTFEKAGTWRFANTAKTIRTQMYQQSRQPPIAVKQTLKTEWIRIRDHWRLVKAN